MNSRASDSGHSGRDDIDRFRDQYSDEDREKLIEALKRQQFFHNMQLGLVRTGSWVYSDDMPPNYHLWPLFQYIAELDLSRARCLDIGTYDGMTAFVLAEYGAARVDATCQYDLDRFRLVRAFRGYNNVAYFPNTDLERVADTFEPGSFDLVVMSAMLHHLTAPLDAILEARRFLKRGGYLLIESIVVDNGAPGLMLNTELEDPVYGAPTLWIPTEVVLLGMLRLGGFDIVSSTRLLGGPAAREVNHERITVLVRAEKPSLVRDRTNKTIEIQSTVGKLGCLNMKALEADVDRPSVVIFAGMDGKRYLNIWQKSPEVPLQPAWLPPRKSRETKFSVALNSDFNRLVAAHPDGAFTRDDLYLLAARYPGEVMPEGMTWGLKQLGVLHIIDYVKKFGLRRVLEVGAGFNFYFKNHLPAWASYTALDDVGFYDEALISMAMERHGRDHFIQGLLGQFSPDVPDGAFDACVSSSVLEHLPEDQILNVCQDMFRVLQPGGWALHSIDFPAHRIEECGRKWLEALQVTGFAVEKDQPGGQFLVRDEKLRDAYFTEPLSIVMRFYGGYKKGIWGAKSADLKHPSRWLTILIAAYKPL